jgi:hypothetical protein
MRATDIDAAPIRFDDFELELKSGELRRAGATGNELAVLDRGDAAQGLREVEQWTFNYTKKKSGTPLRQRL